MLSQSNILVHWTGKEFHPKDEDDNYKVQIDNISDDISNLYLDRLRSFMKNGLYMNHYHEKVIGYNFQGFQSEKLATCFTDLGILTSFNHVKSYGLMGLGFSRKFILERDGRPVWYMLNSSEDLIAATFNKFYNYYLQHKSNHSELDEIYIDMSNMVNYFKGMGKENTTDFDYLQEGEWRIILNQRVLQNEKISKSESANSGFTIPISIDDIELIILPNKKIRENLFMDDELRNWICSAKTIPIILSLEEYYSF